MALKLVLQLLLITFVNTYDEREKQFCDSPQYFKLGETVTMNCSFPTDYFGIFWYNTTDFIFAYPIIYLKDSIKAGRGYESGDYDISDNGSLIIRNTSTQYDYNFTVTYLASPEGKPVVTKVEVVVVVIPSSAFPMIDRCGNENRVCSMQVKDHFEINCVIQNARPPVHLTWIKRSAITDEYIPFENSFILMESGYTTRAATIYNFSRSTLLMLFVCKATTLPGMLENNEAVILVQTDGGDVQHVRPFQKYFERNAALKLDCGTDNPMYLLWKMKPLHDNVFHDILFSIYLNENFTQIYSGGFTSGNTGTLFLPSVKVENEGIYRCVYGKNHTDGLSTYRVSVYVNPVPPYPSIEGCNHKTQYCILEVERKGTLTCYLSGIRPEVTLEFRVHNQKKDSYIYIYNHKRLIRSHGETFDIILTSTYDATHILENRLTVECKVVELLDVFSHLTTKLDLLFPLEITADETSEEKAEIPDGTRRLSSQSVLIISNMSVITFSSMIITITVLACSVRKSRKINTNQVVPTDCETQSTNHSQGEISNDRSIDIAEVLVTTLKTKYKELYDAVQPIPYIKDRLHCVDKVFVEVGIKLISSSDESEDNWEELESYRNILDNSKIQSSRRILEGEPGYGKSTISLQFAYDWSMKTSESALQQPDVFILLQLRQLKGVTSFYKAVKQLLLPKDSPLSENDIKYVIQKSNNLVIVLDGFDEYPEQNSQKETDIKLIIKNEILQNSTVILTTRVRLPETLRSSTHKRVKLIGFSEMARLDYIKKAVVVNDVEAAHEINQRLRMNPLLGALCQVPLFFVMFAHLTYEKEDFKHFTSVTKFFRYMVSCFHSHLKNKLDRNSREMCDVFEREHSKLDIVAFKALTEKKEQIVWDKTKLCDHLGKDFFQHYKQVGLLVEENILEFHDNVGVSAAEHIQEKTQVRFYHKLFCEWYAAHRLSEIAVSPIVCKVYHTLKKMDPFDLQYVYRFACGLNVSAADRIVQFLQRDDKTFENFVVLCTLEKSDRGTGIEGTVRKICSNNIRLRHGYTDMILWSSIQLLEFASTKRIPAVSLYFDKCFKQVSLDPYKIELKNGNISVPVLKSLKEIVFKGVVNENSKTTEQLTEQETKNIFNYAAMCDDLKILRFHDYILPISFQPGALVSETKEYGFEVLWHTSGPDLRLNLKLGQWETYYDKNELTDDDLKTLMEDFYSQSSTSETA